MNRFLISVVSRRFQLCLIALLFLLACISVAKGMRNGLHHIDFQWVPSKIMISGENPYLYSLNKQMYHGARVEANQVPSCLMLLAPYTLFSRQTANNIWMVSNCFFTFFFLYFLHLLYKKKLIDNNYYSSVFFGISVLLLLAGTSWRALIGNGQHLMFSLCFFAASCYYMRIGNDFLSGVLLALACFKYTVIAPLCFIFLYHKKYIPLIVAMVLHLSATIALGLYLDCSPVTLILQSFSVSNYLIGQGTCDFASIATCLNLERNTIHVAALAGYCFFAVLLICVTFSGKKDIFLKLCIYAIIADFMFYHRIYDFVLMILPFMYVFSKLFTLSGAQKFYKVLSFIICVDVAWINVGWFLANYRLIPEACFNLIFFFSHAILLIFLLYDNWRGDQTYHAETPCRERKKKLPPVPLP